MNEGNNGEKVCVLSVYVFATKYSATFSYIIYLAVEFD